MYESYWGLSEKPFRNTPNPRYLYMSGAHEEALTRLFYAVAERKGGMLLTGDYGCGKTLLSHVLLHEISPDRFEMAMVASPNLTPVEFLHEVLYQFGMKAPRDSSKPDLLHLFERFLCACERAGRHPVLLVDEAQAICQAETLEEIRLLLNMQREDRFLLTLVLAGQPELRGIVEKLPQLKQRLTLRYHLAPLEAAETALYIRHRMQRAGALRPIFTTEAEREIHKAARGVPREVNAVADLALLVGCGRQAKEVGPGLVWDVAHDLAA